MAHTKIGYHLGVGGNKNGLGDWERRLNGKGIPFGFKSVDEFGVLLEALNIGQQFNVNNWLGFRFTKAAGHISRETPNYEVDPVIDAEALAQEFLNNKPTEFDNRVWIELINEPRDENQPGDVTWNNLNACDYLGKWCLAAARYLNTRGYKFMGPGFNSGRPGRDKHPISDAVIQYSEQGMLEYLSYCADNPTMAGLAVHEYVWDIWRTGEPIESRYPSLWGRFEAAIAAADLAGIPRTFPIFVTEFGFELNAAPRFPEVVSYLDYRNSLTARWPQLKFDASWTLQAGWGNVDNDVNTWMNYNEDVDFSEGEQPAKTHDAFGGTLPGNNPITLPNRIKHTIHLLPQDTTTDELVEVAILLHPTRSAFTYSADVCHGLMYVGNDESKVVIWDAHRWPGGVPGITQWFNDRGIFNLELRNFSGTQPPPTIFSNWPTISYKITQVFGANPLLYEPYGLPGHNGIDISVPESTDVFAANNGVVSLVSTTGPLGIHIRINHGGFESEYAHLSAAYVTVGDVVLGGDIIGASGNTGNSTGPHLHFGIKDGQYTDQSGQIWNVDHNPWSYIEAKYIPPAGTVKMQGWLYETSLGIGSDGQAVALGRLNLRKEASAGSTKLGEVPNNTIVFPSNTTTNGYRYCIAWTVPSATQPPLNIIKGVDNPASDWYWPSAKAVFDTLLGKIWPKFHSNGTNINWYDQYKHSTFNVVRVILDTGFSNPDPIAIFNEIKTDIQRWYVKDQNIRFELFNEPNIEHIGLLWNNGSEFGVIFKQVCQLLKNTFPNIKIYYPGLSPQFGAYRVFLNDSKAAGAFDLIDGVCMHSYTGITDNVQNAVNVIIGEVNSFLSSDANGFPVVLSETSVNKPASAIYKAQVYKALWDQLGGIEAAYCFTSSWHPSPDGNQEGFLEHGIHIELDKII